MKTSDAGRKLIKDAEGLRLTAYLCPAGIPSCGYGHTKGVTMATTCTPAQAEQWLTDDLAEAESAIARLVKVPLAQGQFDALASFVYNLGAGKLAQSTLLKLLNAGDYKGAAGQFKLWCHAGEAILLGLVKRRAAETDLFLSAMKAAA